MREVIRLVLVLVLICGISAGALTVARQTLGPRIETQNDLFVRGPALERLFDRPASELLDNKVSLPVGDHLYPVFYLIDEGEIAGLAVEAPGAGGYGGDIVVMIAVNLLENKMLGLEIIQHNETPGVGSQIEKPFFRNQFKGLLIDETVELTSRGGRIDAISGATYSSKAVVNGTNQVIDLMSRHKDEIMASIKAKRE
jgi:electron transport complex protein RnfG